MYLPFLGAPHLSHMRLQSEEVLSNSAGAAGLVSKSIGYFHGWVSFQFFWWFGYFSNVNIEVSLVSLSVVWIAVDNTCMSKPLRALNNVRNSIAASQRSLLFIDGQFCLRRHGVEDEVGRWVDQRGLGRAGRGGVDEEQMCDDPGTRI
ncbi:hypothetical protein B0H14DRAFT_2615301 [Mycena olivaceomarginata]|nr:hypothetical protein B0H14DRAFT_2615301 [Mycena olivaceomarginata]